MPRSEKGEKHSWNIFELGVIISLGAFSKCVSDDDDVDEDDKVRKAEKDAFHISVTLFPASRANQPTGAVSTKMTHSLQGARFEPT